jgi:hypothetical protein
LRVVGVLHRFQLDCQGQCWVFDLHAFAFTLAQQLLCIAIMHDTLSFTSCMRGAAYSATSMPVPLPPTGTSNGSRIFNVSLMSGSSVEGLRSSFDAYAVAGSDYCDVVISGVIVASASASLSVQLVPVRAVMRHARLLVHDAACQCGL